MSEGTEQGNAAATIGTALRDLRSELETFLAKQGPKGDRWLFPKGIEFVQLKVSAGAASVELTVSGPDAADRALALASWELPAPVELNSLVA